MGFVLLKLPRAECCLAYVLPFPAVLLCRGAVVPVPECGGSCLYSSIVYADETSFLTKLHVIL